MKLHCFVSVLSAFFFINKIKWFLVCILWCCFLFGFSVLSTKTTPKDQTQQKKQNPKCRKKEQTKKSVSAVVFTNRVFNFVGWATNMLVIADNPYENRGFSIFWESKRPKRWKRLSQKSVQRWVKNLSKYVCSIIGQILTQKMVLFVFFLCRFEKSHSPCRKSEDFWKTKKEKRRKFWTDLWLKRGQFLDWFLTLQHIAGTSAVHILLRNADIPQFYSKHGSKHFVVPLWTIFASFDPEYPEFSNNLWRMLGSGQKTCGWGILRFLLKICFWLGKC